MPINGAIIKAGATGMSVTGGADITLSPNGVPVSNGVSVANASDADFRTRRNLIATYRPPTLSSDGSYSKEKKTFVFRAPKILASGETVINLIRIEREVHPESTAAEAFELCMIGGQLLSDADFAAFLAGGNLS